MRLSFLSELWIYPCWLVDFYFTFFITISPSLFLRVGLFLSHPIISLSSLRIDILMVSLYSIYYLLPFTLIQRFSDYISYLSISIPSHVYILTLISTRRYYTYTLIVPVASDIWNNSLFVSYFQV